MQTGVLLKGMTFHILGGQRVLEAMMKSQGARSTGLNNADFVIFMGGVDVNPELYGEEPHPKTQPPNHERDRIETAVFKSTPNQFRVGICRGAQLLHVLNGGRLWQHVEGHTSSHVVHYETEKSIRRAYNVSSTHHQMMKLPTTSGVVWAWADETRQRELPKGGRFLIGPNHWTDPEVVYYPKTQSLCFQPHPEHFQPKDSRDLFFRCLARAVES
jgi:GMP synthase-like glutamine amidotransferase